MYFVLSIYIPFVSRSFFLFSFHVYIFCNCSALLCFLSSFILFFSFFVHWMSHICIIFLTISMMVLCTCGSLQIHFIIKIGAHCFKLNIKSLVVRINEHAHTDTDRLCLFISSHIYTLSFSFWFHLFYLSPSS